MSDILLDISEGVATITLNRPEKRNVVRYAMWREIEAITGQLAGDDEVRCIVLTGSGDHFCAGADITEFEELRKDPESATRFDAAIEASEASLTELPKPTIAALAGYCIGGGLSLALCCDIRVAHTSSRFAIPAAKLSVLYGLRDSQALYEAVGLAQAKRIMFTADQIDAAEAARIGLVQILTERDVKAEAREVAVRISANAPLSLKGSKQVLGIIARGEASARGDEVRQMQRVTHTSQDHHEAARAFVEKRKPRFVGK